MAQDIKMTSRDIVLDYCQEMGKRANALLDEYQRLSSKIEAKLRVVNFFVVLSMVLFLLAFFSDHDLLFVMQMACLVPIIWNDILLWPLMRRRKWLLKKTKTIADICGELSYLNEMNPGHTRGTNE